ncbi:glycoside hydrolase family 6 protein [Capnocytophaga sp. HP1101]
MKKLLSLIAFLWVMTACEKSGEDTPSYTQTQIPYDWDFYLEPSRLDVVKKEKNAELKKLYYQVYGTPCGGWYDGINPSSEKNDRYLRNFVEGAERAHKTPIVVIYGIPNRDCGSFSKGGHPNGASYKAWIDRVSAIIGKRRAVVIIEPDAINYCGHPRGSAKYNERAELLSYAAEKLNKNNPNVASYIHAGNGPLVTQNPEAVANAIIDGGLQYMRGFALNVSGLGGTAEEQAGAEKFVAYLATKGFDKVRYVIDTGRSGINRPKHQNPNPPFNSCNNFNAALGPRSTTKTTGAHADAYLWINGGGGSDGECNMGAPKAGLPYPEYTRHLVQNAIRVKSIEILEVPQDLK